jgi:hypothetical protein
MTDFLGAFFALIFISIVAVPIPLAIWMVFKK